MRPERERQRHQKRREHPAASPSGCRGSHDRQDREHGRLAVAALGDRDDIHSRHHLQNRQPGDQPRQRPVSSSTTRRDQSQPQGQEQPEINRVKERSSTPSKRLAQDPAEINMTWEIIRLDVAIRQDPPHPTTAPAWRTRRCLGTRARSDSSAPRWRESTHRPSRRRWSALKRATPRSTPRRSSPGWREASAGCRPWPDPGRGVEQHESGREPGGRMPPDDTRKQGIERRCEHRGGEGQETQHRHSPRSRPIAASPPSCNKSPAPIRHPRFPARCGFFVPVGETSTRRGQQRGQQSRKQEAPDRGYHPQGAASRSLRGGACCRGTSGIPLDSAARRLSESATTTRVGPARPDDEPRLAATGMWMCPRFVRRGPRTLFHWTPP